MSKLVEVCLGFGIALALFLALSLGAQAADIHYVPDDYPTIQSAINNASDGDTIIVRDGTYYENLVVNKQVTLKSENGSANCIIDGSGSGHVVNLSADGIWIEGFTIRNSSSRWNGIYVYYSNNNTIANSRIVNNGYGIVLLSSNYTTIANNTVEENLGELGLVGSGIYMGYSNNNTIANNTVGNNSEGIEMLHSNNNTITNNTIGNNNNYGIDMRDSNNNTITYNTITQEGGSIGIDMQDSNYNTIANNTIRNNYYGISMRDSNYNNVIYLNNFIDNTDNVYSYNSYNIWHSPENITYTYNGNTYINYLGNYWSDYTGSDSDRDGIGDTPYTIDFDDADNYPLMEPWENYLTTLTPTPTPAQAPDLTVTNIEVNPVHPVVNQTVTINATVKNVGNESSTAFNVTFYVNNSPFETFRISLNAGEETILTSTWTPDSAGAYTIKVVADTNNEIDEINETNNTAEVAVSVVTPAPTPEPTPTQNHTISLPQIEIQLNQTAEIPVTLSSPTNITGVNFTLIYNSSVIEISDAQTLLPSQLYTNIDNTSGVARFAIVFNTSFSGDMPILNLTVTAKSPGYTTLEIVGPEISGEDFNVTSVNTFNGSVTVMSPVTRGDMNKDGNIDIVDVTMVAYMVVGKLEPDLTADFNGNGRVDIGDLAKIAHYLLGKISTL